MKRTLLGHGMARIKKPGRGMAVVLDPIRPQLRSQLHEKLFCIPLDIFRAVDLTPDDGFVRLFDMVNTFEKIKGLNSLFNTLVDRQSAFEVEPKLGFDRLDAGFVRHHRHVVDEPGIGRVLSGSVSRGVKQNGRAPL